jgi:hypothetical protein
MHLGDELEALLAALEARGAGYALAGGLALAVHGIVRATADIDLVVPDAELDAVAAVAHACGFTVATTLTFASGLEIRRLAKIEGDETLILDLLRADGPGEEAYRTRLRIQFSGQEIAVVSRQGLVAMKLAAGRDQDLVDVRRLLELEA